MRRASSFLVALLAALTLAQATAAIADPSIQTDMWVYQDGDTVIVTGVEFGPTETVEVVSTAPSGSEVDRGTAETDAEGSFTYSFVLHASESGIYDVVATGQDSGLSAETQFDPPAMFVWSLKINPTTTAISASHLYTLTAKNESPTNGTKISCIKITIPSAFTPSGTTTVTPPAGKTWSVSRVGQVITVQAAANNDRQFADEVLTIGQNATAPGSATGHHSSGPASRMKMVSPTAPARRMPRRTTRRASDRSRLPARIPRVFPR